MEVDEYYGIRVTQMVRPMIGPFKGRLCCVIKIEVDAGAKNGWFTCHSPEGTNLLFAGEEIELAKFGKKIG